MNANTDLKAGLLGCLDLDLDIDIDLDLDFGCGGGCDKDHGRRGC